MKGSVVSGATESQPSHDWVGDVLLRGDDDEICLRFDRPVNRATLRALVDDHERDFAAAGLLPGGTIALRLPPSLTYVAMLLAAWRLGAQVSLLDHRLTQHEVDRALDRIAAQFVVTATEVRSNRLRGYADVLATALTQRDGKSPQLAWFAGHNHVSTVMSFGTAQDDVGSTIRVFIAGIK